MQYRIILFISSLICANLTPLFSQQYDPPANDKEFERQHQERIKKDRLNGIYIPKNLEDAIAQLEKLTSPDARMKFMAIPEDTVCLIMHNRLGQWMIVNWSFYEGSRLSNYLHSAGVTYPDDMADLLILAFHRHLHAKPVVIRDLAQHFRNKRKQTWDEERRDGEVIKEIVRQRPKPEPPANKPAATDPAVKPRETPKPATPKGAGSKQ